MPPRTLWDRCRALWNREPEPSPEVAWYAEEVARDDAERDRREQVRALSPTCEGR